jgi:hypothetical protein
MTKYATVISTALYITNSWLKSLYQTIYPDRISTFLIQLYNIH